MGTKAGAEKSRLKREEKARLRAQTEALADAPGISPSIATSESGGSLILENQTSDVLTLDQRPELPSQGQALAEVMLDAAAPEAVRVMVETMRQRKSPALRFAAATKLIDATVLRERKQAPGGAGDESMTAKLARAFQLRQRAAGAVDAVPSRVEPVTPEAAVHSQQAPDK